MDNVKYYCQILLSGCTIHTVSSNVGHICLLPASFGLHHSVVVDCGGGDVEGMEVGPWGEAGLVAMAGGAGTVSNVQPNMEKMYVYMVYQTITS